MSASRQTGIVVKRPSLRHRIFLALAIMATVAVAVGTVAQVGAEQANLAARARATLSREAGIITAALDASPDPESEVAALVPEDARLTLISPDGTILYDSEADASAMPNHADRPEVARALKDGIGVAERPSETVGYVSHYQARRIDSGDVVRLSVDRADVAAEVWSGIGYDLVGVALVVTAAWIVSGFVARRLIAPIAAMDLASDDPEAGYEELEPLAARAREARAAEAERLATMADAVRMRREFTANVTHELKTPLASILMASELIENGMCAPLDVPGFAERIHSEASRMESLVSDLLVLSRLDESERAGDRSIVGATESLELNAVVRDAVARLEPQAIRAHVALEVSVPDGPLVSTGNPKLLDLLVSNLVENAIRYNRRGGWVRVALITADGHPRLTVADSGEGIPKEAQRQVFERFFRVDASRSRELGGTGLGLSIVKHAATFHHATVSLESEPGHGTVVTVDFRPPSSR